MGFFYVEFLSFDIELVLLCPCSETLPWWKWGCTGPEECVNGCSWILLHPTTPVCVFPPCMTRVPTSAPFFLQPPPEPPLRAFTFPSASPTLTAPHSTPGVTPSRLDAGPLGEPQPPHLDRCFHRSAFTRVHSLYPPLPWLGKVRSSKIS